VLDSLWLLILFAFEGLALWQGNGLLTLAASLALFVSASLLLMRRVALVGVQFRHRLSQHRASFGEIVEFTVELTNLKPLPLTWLRVEDDVPRFLSIEGGRIMADRSEYFPYLVMVIAMLPYERLVRRHRVRCTRRGEYKFGPAMLESGDYLGVLTAYGSARIEDRLLVFPKVCALELGGFASQLLMGRDPVRRLFLPDPMRVIGARAYQSGDPYKLIDWRATAKAGSLMVHILEPSSTPVLDIVLDLAGPPKVPADYAPDEVELAVCVAASLARFAVERRMAVGVRGNGNSRNALLDIAPSARDDQFGVLMEALAHANTLPSIPLHELLNRPTPHIPSGATTIIVTAALRDNVLAAALDLQRRRRAFLLIHVASADTPTRAEGLPVLKVTYDKTWSERQTLVLAA
jgi:uncharacterized protein (DUF58 family)